MARCVWVCCACGGRTREEFLTCIAEGFAGGVVYVEEAGLTIEDVHQVVELLDGERANSRLRNGKGGSITNV